MNEFFIYVLIRMIIIFVPGGILLACLIRWVDRKWTKYCKIHPEVFYKIYEDEYAEEAIKELKNRED